MKLYPIEKKIKSALINSVKRNWQTEDGSALWTKIVKNSLANLGRKLKCKTYAAGCEEADEGEWLFDLCWSVEQKSWKYFDGLKLACEIEWNSDEESILEDFQKLTIALADYHLMVIEYSTLDYAKFRINLCKKASSRFPGQRFMVICIPRKEPIKLVTEAWTT